MDFNKIISYTSSLDEENLFKYINGLIRNREVLYTESTKIIEALQEGMKDVGERFEQGEYLVGDIIYAGELISELIDILKPYIPEYDWKSHEDIGKYKPISS